MDKQLLLSAEIQAFIKMNETADLNALMLQRDKYPHWPLSEIIEQIRSRQKAKEKLPTWYNTEHILFPNPISIEQASSEIAAEWKANYIGKRDNGIDLTGGFGIDSYFFAQNFGQWVHVEPNLRLQEVVKHNFSILEINNVSFTNLKSEDYAKELANKVDFIYLDPDRRPTKQKVAGFKESQPDITTILPRLSLLTPEVLVKASPMIDIKAGLRDLDATKSVIILAHNNEVKEVLFHLDFANNNEPTIRCINIVKQVEELFEFIYNDILEEEIKISSLSTYLYEPNAAIMKSGGQDLLASRYELEKLHRHTHLYTSDRLVAEFPGRVFKVDANLPYKKRLVMTYLPEGKANLSTRNFIDTPAEMKKKLGTRDGGYVYLFGFRDKENNNRVAVCQKTK